MVQLEIIDPRPFSDDELQALGYGLKRFSITEEENFFFGLVVQTQFGVEKVIPFFSPDRQNFIEYDISYLIDTAITRQKRTVGILSSLPVMGDDVTGYMAQMKRMQGQELNPPWTFVEQLKRKYQVESVPTDVNQIKDVDILLVIHPKDLPEKTLFAIDQFVLKGGRTIVCIDPYCVVDRPDRTKMAMSGPQSQSSNLNPLLKSWGLEMPENTFAGDRDLAIKSPVTRDQRPEKIIGFLELKPPKAAGTKPGFVGGCFNTDAVITAELNQVIIPFAGVLNEIADANDKAESNINYTPLIYTTSRGNSWKISSPYELMVMDPSRLMSKFIEGIKPVTMGYLVTGRFRSSYPDGIEIEVDSNETESSEQTQDPNERKKTKKLITGLKQATEDCTVVVFSDVDFISDNFAYSSFPPFGMAIVGDNSTLMLNAIDDLTGSSDLISIRSRGNFRRPFIVVDEIERQAEIETAEEVAKLNAEIAGYNQELQAILASAKQGEQEIIGSTIVQKRRELELKKLQAQRQLREVNMKRRERIDTLAQTLQNINMLTAPAVILVIAVILAIHRSVRKRHYISHASDT
jgi:ABC-type uncharacterized transport system involved in gliding motility auxiliary subunit